MKDDEFVRIHIYFSIIWLRLMASILNTKKKERKKTFFEIKYERMQNLLILQFEIYVDYIVIKYIYINFYGCQNLEN